MSFHIYHLISSTINFIESYKFNQLVYQLSAMKHGHSSE